VNVFPTAAGHQLDLNHLWNQVQELSGLLERNRESSQGIVRRVGEIRVGVSTLSPEKSYCFEQA
jgi:hypothetical protein